MAPRFAIVFGAVAPLVWTACVKRAPGPASGGAELLIETPEVVARPEKPDNARPAMPGKNVPAIKVDTVGYPSSWQKVAIFNVEPLDAALQDATSGQVVYRVPPERITPKGLDVASRDPVWRVDFSDFRQPGRYVMTGGGARSDAFEVADGLYRTALVAGIKSFYFQRTRTKLEKPYAVWEGDEFTREGVSHTHDQVGWLFEEFPNKKTRLNVEAGWHDAGNFDMYVPSTAPSALALLRAFERHPELFSDGDTNIPESGNGIPDILDEAAWGIRWVLSMQATDGGFRVREANDKIGEPGEGPADRDTTARWLDRVGSASTGKGCALAAATARVYQTLDPKLSERAADAAHRAWRWLQRHPERVMVPPVGVAANKDAYQLWDDGNKTKSDIGARLIAGVEMWRTFGDGGALESVRKLLADPETRAELLEYGGWTNLTRWGLMALSVAPGAPADLKELAKGRLIAAAQTMRSRLDRDGYMCVTKPEDYHWGSNADLMDKAELLLHAAEIDPQGCGWARDAAREQWHWLMGRNPNGFSMVTRVGKGPRALYHMEWGGLYPKVPPGFLIGGPNSHDMPFLAPGAPAKALLWEAPNDLGRGAKKGELWHWAQSDLWETGLVIDGSWGKGWWCVTEPDILYEASMVLVATEMQTP